MLLLYLFPAISFRTTSRTLKIRDREIWLTTAQQTLAPIYIRIWRVLAVSCVLYYPRDLFVLHCLSSLLASRKIDVRLATRYKIFHQHEDRSVEPARSDAKSFKVSFSWGICEITAWDCQIGFERKTKIVTIYSIHLHTHGSDAVGRSGIYVHVGFFFICATAMDDECVFIVF